MFGFLSAPHPLVLSLLTGLLIALTGCGGGSSTAAPIDNEMALIGPAPAVPQRARFTPPAGQRALIVGQTSVAIGDYISAFGNPAGFMVYSDLESQYSLVSAGQGSGCNDAGEHNLPLNASRLPRGIVQIGLALTGGQLARAANGQMDLRIVELGATLRALDMPVLLRIGYEFDGPWNAYQPSDYQRAFRRIVSILRGNLVNGRQIEPVTNVAFVWHSAASNAGTFGNRSEEAWYPGDAYVDWIGVSWFGEHSNSAENGSHNARERIASIARARAKPLMIAESAPRTAYPLSSAASWANWYQAVLTWMSANDVRLWSYINQDWRAYPMFAGSCGNGGDIWGDSRVELAEPSLRAAWEAEMAGSQWLQDGPDFLRSIAYRSGN